MTRRLARWLAARRRPERHASGGPPPCPPLQAAVGVEAAEEEVPEVREQDRGKAHHKDECGGTSCPTALVPRMEVDRVDQPRDER